MGTCTWNLYLPQGHGPSSLSVVDVDMGEQCPHTYFTHIFPIDWGLFVGHHFPKCMQIEHTVISITPSMPIIMRPPMLTRSWRLWEGVGFSARVHIDGGAVSKVDFKLII